MPDTLGHLDPIIRKLDSIFRLSGEEREALATLPVQLADIRKDQDVVREGDRPTRCFAIVEGYACTYKLVAGGKRQISAFHIAGDIPDLQSLHLEVLDVSIATVTPCKLAFIQHPSLLRLCEAFPRITAAFWRETLIEAAVAREWVANVGQRRAPARIAHVLCEFFLRMRAVGLTEDHACQFPINQAQLGDATGMSAVHVNRSLQELRAAGLISLKGHSLKILDWAELKAQGDFEPSYLHMERRQDAA